MAPVDITAEAPAVFLLLEVLVLVVLRQAVAEPLTCVLGQLHYPIASLWQAAAVAPVGIIVMALVSLADVAEAVALAADLLVL
jgi:hypothetical protein